MDPLLSRGADQVLTSPYSIYVKKRPLRVAFLVEDKPESMTIINAILAHNRDRWGGRYNSRST